MVIDMKYLINSPRGIDSKIQSIQNLLDKSLDWGEIDIYGRVFKNISKDKGNVLEAYIGLNEYKDVYIDDTKNASIFFVEDEVSKTNDGFLFTNLTRIIFFVNISKIHDKICHRADNEIEIEVLQLLQKKSFFRIKSLEKGIQKSLGGYYTDAIKLADMQPYHIFSITGELDFTINCFKK